MAALKMLGLLVTVLLLGSSEVVADAVNGLPFSTAVGGAREDCDSEGSGHGGGKVCSEKETEVANAALLQVKSKPHAARGHEVATENQLHRDDVMANTLQRQGSHRNNGSSIAGPLRWAKDESYCIDVSSGSTRNGASIQLWTCIDRNPNQQFLWNADERMIRWSTHPNMCLDVKDGKDADGTSIQLWACGGPNQGFDVTGTSSSAGPIKWAAHPSMCVDVDRGGGWAGAKVHLWSCGAQPSLNFYYLGGSPAPTPPLTPLRTCLASLDVIYPGDPSFPVQKLIHNQRVAPMVNPAAIVYVKSAEEVAQTMRCAALGGTYVQARSGGHSYEAYCEDACVMADVTHMKGLAVYTQTDTGILETGLNLGQAYAGLYDKGYAIPAGTCATVGLGGHALGGGRGLLTRTHGMLIDRLVGLDLVLPNASIVHADATQHEDLFWSARGAGLAFPGVATAYHFSLIKAPTMVKFAMTWDYSKAVDVVKYWQDNLVMYEDLGLNANIFLNHLGAHVVMLDCAWADVSVAHANALIEQIRKEPKLSNPKVDYPKSMTFLEFAMANTGVQTRAQLTQAYPPFYGYNSGFDTSYTYGALTFSKLDAAAVEKLVELAGNLPSIQSAHSFFLEITPVNGVASKVLENATAYPWRAPDAVLLQVMLKWPKSQDDSAVWTPWKVNFLTELQKASGTIDSFANYEDRDMPGQDFSGAYFGANQRRVASTWRTYGNLNRRDPPWTLQPVISQM